MVHRAGANKLGRLDPKAGEFKEYRLKTPNSGPHGLVADKAGDIWFTAISGGYVGKLDPKTGAIAEYRPSEGTEIDPHTPVFDHNGILWFTNEETNYVGRLDPRTGKMTLTKSPTPHAVPYGIVVTQNNHTAAGWDLLCAEGLRFGIEPDQGIGRHARLAVPDVTIVRDCDPVRFGLNTSRRSPLL